MGTASHHPTRRNACTLQTTLGHGYSSHSCGGANERALSSGSNAARSLTFTTTTAAYGPLTSRSMREEARYFSGVYLRLLDGHNWKTLPN